MDKVDETDLGIPTENHWEPPPTFASIYPEEDPPILPTYSEDGIDLTVIRWTLSMSPLERLHTAQRHAASVQRLQNALRRV
jgi:hypothetical protein